MASVINTNIASLNAQRNLSTSQSALATSLQRLSSGLRINSAKDDAAGMAISDRMTSQIRGMNQAVRNANDGISLAQTAEGSLNEIGNNLQRLRELAVQAANDTNTTVDRTTIGAEVTQLVSEIDRVASVSSFNGVKLLDGSGSAMVFQVGAGTSASDTITVAKLASAKSLDLGVDATKVKVDTAANATASITAIDAALATVDSSRGDLGAIQNRFTSAVSNLQTTSENLSASRSRIQDADFAAETAALTRGQIMQQAGTAMLAQANQLPNSVLSLLK